MTINLTTAAAGTIWGTLKALPSCFVSTFRDAVTYRHDDPEVQRTVRICMVLHYPFTMLSVLSLLASECWRAVSPKEPSDEWKN